MKHIHLVIPDLFLPQHVAGEACAGLAMPAVEILLARAETAPLTAESLEDLLCENYCVDNKSIAPLTLLADGMQPGASYWLRADPVHLRLQRGQLILQAQVTLTAEEASQLCSSLNAHFSADGLHFFSPHPQRWYLQLDAAPDMSTHHLAQAVEKDVHEHLPKGPEALRWHGVFNEIQMLLFEHEVNQAREARGELPVNSVWLWGGGFSVNELARPYLKVVSDSDVANAFARAAKIPYGSFPEELSQLVAENEGGEVLMVWERLRNAIQRGDLLAWREGMLRFEHGCAGPLLRALRTGRVDRIILDVPRFGASRRFVLTRASAWKLWRRPKPLASYAV